MPKAGTKYHAFGMIQNMSTTLGRRGIVWKTPTVTADGLKMFACLVMFIQSIGIVVVEKGIIHLSQYTQQELSQALAEDSHLMFLAGLGSVLQLIGGLALPIFAFLLVEGFRHTSSYRKYLFSVAGFALLSEIPYDIAMGQKLVDWSSQNALVSMSICLVMLYILRLLRNKKGILSRMAEIVVVACAVFWAALLRAEYGLCLVLLAAVFYLFYTRNVLKTILGIIISLLYVTGPLAFYGIWCYNEVRKDRLPKYAYYFFYPLHLLGLALLVELL